MNENRVVPTYYELFLAFFTIGLTAFGGLAMTAHIRRHIVDKRQWLDAVTFDSGLALCQIIPGAIVMQLAAYIGLKMKGIWGSMVAFIGFGLPAFLIMLALSIIYKHSKDLSAVETILAGLRVLIVAIVANAAYAFGKKNFYNLNDWIIAGIAAVLFFLKLNPVIVLVISAGLGIVLTTKTLDTDTNVVVSKTLRFFFVLILIVSICATALYFINKDYFTLALSMLHIDVFSFGGGLAAMPIMYGILVDTLGWFTDEVFMDGVILGQVTPGSIIIAATFFGYMHFGLWGSILATLCVFTPSFLILMGLIPFFDRLRRFPQFGKVLNGILCSFAGLLVVVTWRFTQGIHWSVFNILFVVIAFLLLWRKVDVIWIILGGIVVTLFLSGMFA